MLSIIIVTFNSAESIERCLKSITRSVKLEHEIIIVDNHSQDGTLAKIKQTGVKARVLGQQQNLGFSKANNIGVAQSNGEMLLFLNPDTILFTNAVEVLAGYLKEHPQTGIAAPCLVDDSGDRQLSVRRLPTIWGAIKEYYLGKKNQYEAYVPGGKLPIEVESVVGAAMMIRKEVYVMSGGFNAKYFMYFEDLDLCRKIRKLGFQVIYLPQAKIRHTVGVSASSNPKARKFLYDSSALYHGRLNAVILDLILRLRPAPN